MIGKSYVSLNNSKWFILTISGIEYIFTKDSVSSSVANIYNYSKSSNSDDWFLYIFASGLITFFNKIPIDICAIGGGGGGGGSWYQAYPSAAFTAGGSGGGGGYLDVYNQILLKNHAYTITIGAGGTGATGAGNNGGSTSLEAIITAVGGGGGKKGTSSGAGSTGTPNKAQDNCFHDSNYLSVCGANRRSYYGGGGGGGAATYNTTVSGTAGKQGLICIRNAR